MRLRPWMAAGVLVLAIAGAGELRAQSVEDRPLPSARDGAKQSPEGYWTRVLLSLAVVGGLVYLARVLLKRSRLSGHGAMGRGGALEVLARTSLSMKHQVLVVRLGQRVLLVGMWPQGMRTLCELSSPQEIAAMLDSLKQGGGDEFLRKLSEKSDQFAAAEQPGGESSVRRLSSKLQQKLGEGQQ